MHSKHSLAKFLWFYKEIEVGLFQLLCDHLKYIRRSYEVCQVVNDQFKQKLHKWVQHITDVNA